MTVTVRMVLAENLYHSAVTLSPTMKQRVGSWAERERRGSSETEEDKDRRDECFIGSDDGEHTGDGGGIPKPCLRAMRFTSNLNPVTFLWLGLLLIESDSEWYSGPQCS